MFNQLCSLINKAHLLGLSVTIKPIENEKISVVLSFLVSPILDPRAFEQNKNNDSGIESVIQLQSALAVPMVLVGTPDEIPALLQQSIYTVENSLAQATAQLSALDLSAMLSSATAKASAAPTTKAAAETKKAGVKVKPAVTSVDETDLEPEIDNDDEPVETAAPVQTSSFDDFTSL